MSLSQVPSSLQASDNSTKDESSKDSTVSSTGKTGGKKGLSFGNVKVRSFDVCLGDNPSVKSGLPLQLVWDHLESMDFTLEEFECTKGEDDGKNRTVSRLSKEEREELLRSKGHTRASFTRVSKEIGEIKSSRDQTANERKLKLLDQLLEQQEKLEQMHSQLNQTTTQPDGNSDSDNKSDNINSNKKSRNNKHDKSDKPKAETTKSKPSTSNEVYKGVASKSRKEIDDYIMMSQSSRRPRSVSPKPTETSKDKSKKKSFFRRRTISHCCDADDASVASRSSTASSKSFNWKGGLFRRKRPSAPGKLADEDELSRNSSISTDDESDNAFQVSAGKPPVQKLLCLKL